MNLSLSQYEPKECCVNNVSLPQYIKDILGYKLVFPEYVHHEWCVMDLSLSQYISADNVLSHVAHTQNEC